MRDFRVLIGVLLIIMSVAVGAKDAHQFIQKAPCLPGDCPAAMAVIGVYAAVIGFICGLLLLIWNSTGRVPNGRLTGGLLLIGAGGVHFVLTIVLYNIGNYRPLLPSGDSFVGAVADSVGFSAVVLYGICLVIKSRRARKN